MDNEEGCFIVAMMVIVLCMFGSFGVHSCTVKQMQTEAVANKVAEWQIIDDKGTRKFVYKKPCSHTREECKDE